MIDSYAFAVDVFRTVGDRLREKAAALRLLVEAAAPFGAWLTREAYLACKRRQAAYPFCEVAADPTYASEGVGGDDDSDAGHGGLRVGGPDGGANHCWVFAEFVLFHGGNREGGEWRRAVEARAGRLKRLGWKKSAALLVVAAATRGDVATEWADDLTGGAAWDRPALTDPYDIALPGAGSVALRAFDIKRDTADTLIRAG